MSKKLVWDEVTKREYETGVEKGVLYPEENGTYPKGEAWNGLIGVSEKPSGAEPTPLYANNKKYLELVSNEEFGATIEAYTYPDGFEPCQGLKEISPGVVIAQQNRKGFGLSYVTLKGNYTEGTDYGYKIHLVYGAKAKPSEKANKTVNGDPEALVLSWEISTTPVEVPNAKPTAHVIIDSTKVNAEELAALEDVLYGSEDAEARLPLPTELIELFPSAVAAG